MFAYRDHFTESYLPNEFPGRDKQLDELSAILDPTTEGQPAQSCWAFGPSGVGKTSTVRYLLEELEVKYGVPSARVECLGETYWELLEGIANDHPNILLKPNTSAETILDRISTTNSEPFVIVLDEFDGLEHPELIADLDAIDHVSLICIGHDRDDAAALLPPAAQSLELAPAVEYEPYHHDAMLDILRARVESGLQPDVITTDQLERIADHAAGSARHGVQALRSAVELGEERGHTEVREADIDDCFEHADERIRRQLLTSLSRQHHVLYQVIRDAGAAGIRAGELLEQYRERSDDPKSRQMVGRYRDKLERYDLIEVEGSGRWARYFVVDETLAAPKRETRVA